MEAAAHPSRVPSPSSVGFHRPRRRFLPMRMMRYAVCAHGLHGMLPESIPRAPCADSQARCLHVFTVVAALARAAHARDDMDIYVLLECTVPVRSSLAAFSRACANPLSSLGMPARSAGWMSLARAPAVALVSPHSHAPHAHGPRRLVMASCTIACRVCGVVCGIACGASASLIFR